VLRPDPVTGLRGGRTAVLLGCEGGDFLEGDPRRLEEARAAGVSVLTLVHYRVNEIGDVQTAPPVAIGTDLDGNYRPVLTSYAQFEDLAGLLRDRGLPRDRIRQILGGNIAALLRRVIP
jgi:microsomal dipeptidase-like Zn-dependent dipeptidase